jgi:hypothetical protein
MVISVQVTILDETGKVMEQGEATRMHGDWWEYFSTVQGKTIIAEAHDLPQNTTTFILE